MTDDHLHHQMGHDLLADVATIARPDTILGWYCRLSPEIRWLEGRSRSGQTSDQA